MIVRELLKQLVSRLWSVANRVSRSGVQHKISRFSTFVPFEPLFQSACNRETSSKCKRGSFLQSLPKTTDVTSLSNSLALCVPRLWFTPLFPSLSPSNVIDQAASQEGGEGGLTLGRGQECLRRTSAAPRLRLSLPRCLLVSQQRFTTCYEEGSEAHSWQDTSRLSQGKYHWVADGREKEFGLKRWIA